LMARYHVDVAHAERVADTALKLWRQVAPDLRLPLFTKRYLQYAALTHEIGLNINSSGLQKHSAYILEHSNLPGFSFDQQRLVALMVRMHRKKLKRSLVTNLGMISKRHAVTLILLLRMAVLWHLTRNPETPEVPQMEFDGENLTLRLDATIAEENPLLIADLEREEAYCEQFGLTTRLEFRL
jgi:exopolyphosphatase/guanosine-5'-triphosphate,3'-diphosphate pyrophosphatase